MGMRQRLPQRELNTPALREGPRLALAEYRGITNIYFSIVRNISFQLMYL